MQLPHASTLVALVLAIAACAVLAPFWAPLLLAVWVGIAGRRLMVRILPLVRGSEQAAAILTILLFAIVAAPIVALLTSLALDAFAFLQKAAQSDEIREFLAGLASGGPADEAAPTPPTELSATELLSRFSERAVGAFSYLAGAAVWTVLNTVVFFVALYSVLIDGPRAWRYAVAHAPIPEEACRRFGAAFVETGYGLVVSFGVAAFVQALIGTVTFAVLGVARPVVLGLLMFVGAAIPGIGTAFVWAPVAAGLAFAGRTEAALVLVLIGLFVIGTVDNLIKPILARRAALMLPTAIVLVSMLGGLAVLGAAGILAGPLLVRLAVEAAAIERERRDAREAARVDAASASGTESLEPNAASPV
jgi:predicted PurR-regulated permease PerM